MLWAQKKWGGCDPAAGSFFRRRDQNRKEAKVVQAQRRLRLYGKYWKRWACGILSGALILWQWTLFSSMIRQLFLGLLVMLAALPLMRRLERRLPSSWAATLAMTGLSAGLGLFFLVLIPPLAGQARQIGTALPGLYRQIGDLLRQGEEWLSRNGVALDQQMQETLLEKGELLLSDAAGSLTKRLNGVAGGIGRWMLAPVFAFYLLRDRRRIADWLLSLLPLNRREMTVRIVREMGRESVGYLRGQLLVSLAVGGFTGLGLLLCGVPSWLLLGFLMGLLELIPYVGPFLGGVLVALFAWPGGWSRMLWSLGVVVLVQQLEGGMLSPQLMSETTRLHPIVVLLCVMAGGAAGGIAGVLLAIPAVLCLRAALRVIQLKRLEEQFEET
mgnify:FL=1